MEQEGPTPTSWGEIEPAHQARGGSVAQALQQLWDGSGQPNFPSAAVASSSWERGLDTTAVFGLNHQEGAWCE